MGLAVKKSFTPLKTACLKKELSALQQFWSKKAKGKGILTEKDLQAYLKKSKIT